MHKINKSADLSTHYQTHTRTHNATLRALGYARKTDPALKRKRKKEEKKKNKQSLIEIFERTAMILFCACNISISSVGAYSQVRYQVLFHQHVLAQSFQNRI